MDAAITIADETRSRVALADATVRLLRSLWQVHGPLMFHQSGGCCDGSSPMCFPVGDFHTTEHDVLLGRFDLIHIQPQPAQQPQLEVSVSQAWVET